MCQPTKRSSRNRLFIVLAALVSIGLPGCAPPASRQDVPVLLFNGTGTSENDVAALEQILKDNSLEYVLVNSAQLNDMSSSQLMAHRLLIVPGGNFITIGNGLSANTPEKIRGAVKAGMNYLGICAGAFLAGDGPQNCLNLTEGVRFDFYADLSRGIRKSAVAITTVDSPALDHYWEDGPQLTGWGTVVGKYPDGTPAIVQGKCGKGFVLLTGVHPEAPENWRHGMSFTTPVDANHAYAARLIGSALHGKWLPHF